jgi:hypothetical protein
MPDTTLTVKGNLSIFFGSMSISSNVDLINDEWVTTIIIIDAKHQRRMMRKLANFGFVNL